MFGSSSAQTSTSHAPRIACRDPIPSNFTPTTPTLVTFFEKLSFLLRSCLGAPIVPCFLALKNGTVLMKGRAACRTFQLEDDFCL